LPACGEITGVAATPTAAWIIRDDVIDEIVIAGVAQLVSLAWLKEKRVSRAYDYRSIFVADAAATRDHEIKLCFSGVGMIRTIRFALWNPDQRQIKRVTFKQIERFRLPPPPVQERFSIFL